MGDTQDEIRQPLNRGLAESEYVDQSQEDNSNITAQGIVADMNQKITKIYQFDGLQGINVWGYSLGHFFNDLCAAVWFNYLLFYLKVVRGLNDIAPYSMLGGQIFDGIATPVVGILSDRTNTRIGKRTPWYLFGTVLVVFTFLPIFIYQFVPVDTPNWAKFIYFVSFPSIFNIGWASVQISNMSLVPSLTCSTTKRDILNSRRNTFTFVANFSVLLFAGIFFLIWDGEQAFESLAFFVVGLGLCTTGFFLFTVKEVPLVEAATKCADKLKKILLNEIEDAEQKIKQSQATKDKKQESDQNKLLEQQQTSYGEHDNPSNVSKNSQEEHIVQRFRQTLQQNKNPKKSMNSMSMGGMMRAAEGDADYEVDQTGHVSQSLASMRLTLKTKEMKERHSQGEKEESGTNWRQWFKESLFYICGIIYMFVRLYCNVIATMLQFYMAYVCEFVDVNDGEEINITKLPFQMALVPLLLYVFSTVSSSFVEILFQKIGRKRTYFIGAFFATITSVGYIFIEPSISWLIYPVSCFTGIAQALCLNTGITLISDVIGCRGSEGAFVFGVYSFLDKFCTGIVMFLLTDLFEFTVPIVRWSTAMIPFVSVVVAGIFITMIKTNEDGFKHKNEESEEMQDAQQMNIKKLNDELAI